MLPEWWWSWALDMGYLLSVFLTGRKHAVGWLVGALTGAAWLVYATHTRQWGFFPGTTIGLILCLRNWRSWHGKAA